MDSQCLPSSMYTKGQRDHKFSSPCSRVHNQTLPLSFKSSISYIRTVSSGLEGKSWGKICVSTSNTTKRCVVVKLREEVCATSLPQERKKKKKKKGSVAGAVALIVGTSIGSGILALPQKTYPAGLVPSSITMTICWAFLVMEALLLVEINVRLLQKKRRKLGKNRDLEVISIRTMAQETLGHWGGNIATVTYIFLGYTSMVAYSSKSGQLLHHLINLPESVSGFIFTILFSILVYAGGTQGIDQVNRWLTASMIGLLVVIEVIAVTLGEWTTLDGPNDWEKVRATIPVIIFSLVYHDLAPVLCAYLDGDLKRIRASIILGSVVPLLALLVWDAIALGMSSVEQVSDPVQFLTSVRFGGVSVMVEAFSLLAVATSLIGTLLGFSEFFKEQLNIFLNFDPSSTQIFQKPEKRFSIRKWWGRNKISFTATAMVIAPTLFVSVTVPDAFSAATDIAGGYCMTTLYGVLPPAMAWAMHNEESADQKISTKPALVGAGLFACGIVLEQILQDLSVFHF